MNLCGVSVMAGQLQQLYEIYAEISHSGIQCDCLRLHSKIFQFVPAPFNCPFLTIIVPYVLDQ